jgi:hypothetical protein
MNETTKSVSETPLDPMQEAMGAFMQRWEDSPKEETSEPVVEGEAESVDVEVSEETEEAFEDQEVIEEVEIDLDEEIDTEYETEEEVEYEVAADDLVTKVKVGDEELEVPVKDLKRLYGQEKALTKKSQQVAEMRKALEAETQKNAAVLQTLMQKAEEKLKPYAEIDMLVASRQMDPDDFAQLRKEAAAAMEEYEFLNQETSKYIEMIQAAQSEELKKKVADTMDTLKADVPEWSEDLYNKLREYGVSQGISKTDIDQLVDPAAIKLILKAMKYDAAKKVAVKKRAKAPKKILKPGATKPTSQKARVTKQAMENLAKSGSTDAARDAFLARWSADSKT